MSKYLTHNSKVIFAIKKMKTHKHVGKTFKAFGNIIEILYKNTILLKKSITFPLFNFNHLQLNNHFPKISSSILNKASEV